jgi:hypothetical protein
MDGSGSDRLPQFLCVGTQKGGTTTLHALLSGHPQVFLPQEKELHFFSSHHGSGPRWYSNHFLAACPGQVRGEITPYYLFHPEAPRRIQALLPQARLIVLLRDPVARTLSQYFHSYRLGLETLDLEAALRAESVRLMGSPVCLAADNGRHPSHQEHSYLARSRYEQQLPRYMERFSANQLLLLRSEDLFQQPAMVWRQLLLFLSLDCQPLPPMAAANRGGGEEKTVPRSVQNWIRDQLEPTYRVMEQSYGIRWDPT